MKEATRAHVHLHPNDHSNPHAAIRPLARAVLAVAFAATLAACGTPPRPVQAMPAELLDSAVTPENVQQTICRIGYTASATPPDAWSSAAMRRLLLRGGTELAVSGTYVLDRVVPISLGGHATQEANLQLLELSGNRSAPRKRALERRLHQLVCAGKLGLREAQSALYPDWAPAYGRYIEGEGGAAP